MGIGSEGTLSTLEQEVRNRESNRQELDKANKVFEVCFVEGENMKDLSDGGGRS